MLILHTVILTVNLPSFFITLSVEKQNYSHKTLTNRTKILMHSTKVSRHYTGKTEMKITHLLNTRLIPKNTCLDFPSSDHSRIK